MSIRQQPLGTKLISETTKHNATIAMMPFRNDIWRDNGLYARRVVFDAVKKIANHEKVYLCVDIERQKADNIKLPNKENIIILPMKYDDIWARDISPSFISVGDSLKAVCWKFNAWNGIYTPFDNDAEFAKNILKYLSIEFTETDIVFEGGAMTYNGNGIAITTESVLLNRNPTLTKIQIEEAFKNMLGVEKLIWLKRGLLNDETNGHVDNFITFVDEETLLLSWTDDANNPQYEILYEAEMCIKKESSLKGNPFSIKKIPLPEAMYITETEASGLKTIKDSKPRIAGDVLLATYNNAYVFNEGVILPIYESEYDDVAIKIYKELYPNRIIYPILSKELLIGGGSFHCIFHEIPEVIDL